MAPQFLIRKEVSIGYNVLGTPVPFICRYTWSSETNWACLYLSTWLAYPLLHYPRVGNCERITDTKHTPTTQERTGVVTKTFASKQYPNWGTSQTLATTQIGLLIFLHIYTLPLFHPRVNLMYPIIYRVLDGPSSSDKSWNSIHLLKVNPAQSSYLITT